MTLRTPDAVLPSRGLPLFRGNRLRVIQAVLLVLAGWYVFSPAIHGGWLWDDHEIRENPNLHDWAGLGKIWVAPAATDYLPVEATVLWAEWHLWGDAVAGYHATSIALHLLSAFLIWHLLRRQGVGFAWLAGLLFVVHPVAVESVAWISEIKNTLSLPFLLLAFDFWIRKDSKEGGAAGPSDSSGFDSSYGPDGVAGTRRPTSEIDSGLRSHPSAFCQKNYLISLIFFLAAMLSKSSVVMFPVFLLLLAWWRRGRIGWADVRAAAPFFAVALVLGWVTVHFQAERAIRDWQSPDPGFLPRLGGAGLALSFYLGKCLFPVEVMPIYPGWTVGTTSLIAFLPWLILAAVVAGCFYSRKEAQGSKGGAENKPALNSGLRSQASAFCNTALPALGWFVLFLLPVLGFIPMSYQHIAPVADHLAYISLVGVVSLAAAGFWTLDYEQKRKLPYLNVENIVLGVVAAIVAALAVESHLYAAVFTDQEAMWTYNAVHNSRSASVYANLGFVLNRNGKTDRAVTSYEKAIQLDPEDPDAEDELAGVLADQGRIAEAAPHYERAIALYKKALARDPGLRDINNKLGLDLAAVGRMDEALEQFEEAVRRNPDSYEDQTNLANVLANQPGRLAEAIAHFDAALALNPDSAMIHNNLGYALMAAGRPSEAIVQYEEALRLNPVFPGAHNNLGYALAQLGRFSEARSQFEEALRLRPDDPDARSNLARLDALQKGP